jgi:hypothetical protein
LDGEALEQDFFLIFGDTEGWIHGLTLPRQVLYLNHTASPFYMLVVFGVRSLG